MSYDWSKNSEGGEQAEPLPAGAHNVRIDRVVYEKKGAGPFTSKSGDPQIMCIFVDEQGREASQMFTLSANAAWRLAGILKASGANVERMTAQGVEPEDFAEPMFGNKNLVGRKLRVKVEWKIGDNGKDYAEVWPVKTNGTQAQTNAPQRPTPRERIQNRPPATDPLGGPGVPEDDIPFAPM